MIEPRPGSSFDLSFTLFGRWVDKHPSQAGLVLALAAVGVGIAALTSRQVVRAIARRNWTGEQAVTVSAAAIATGVSGQGMWVFSYAALHLACLPRMAFFAFLEVMVVGSALRARAAQRVGGSPGADGIAMWALTCLSAILSATEADNLGMLLLRLSAPIVAAWGWERSMALERSKRTGARASVNWRITPERLLIRMGLAHPDTEGTASGAAAQRRLVAVALAVDDARAIRSSERGSIRQLRRAHHRLRNAMRRATAEGDLVSVEGRDHREVLVDYIAVLRSTSSLLDLNVPNPFASARTDAQDDAAQTRTSSERPNAAPENDCGAYLKHGDPTYVRSSAHRDVESLRPIDGLPAGHSGDVWQDVADKVCADHPMRRRQRAGVEAILRLHYLEHRTYPEIAREVGGFSKHAVGRVIRQARPYHTVS